MRACVRACMRACVYEDVCELQIDAERYVHVNLSIIRVNAIDDTYTYTVLYQHDYIYILSSAVLPAVTPPLLRPTSRKKGGGGGGGRNSEDLC